MNVMDFDLSGPIPDTFIDLPWHIYPKDHLWVPPLRPSIAAELSPRNPFFAHANARAFMVEIDGKVVGRVVASIDRHLVQDSTETIGHFGYFECINDQNAAEALLNSAEAWLKAQGATAVHGPMNLNIMIGYRLQTAGFQTTPFLGEPRNPEYYQSLIEGCGYSCGKTWRSWDANPTDFAAIADSAAAHGAAAANRFTMRQVDQARIDEELAEFYPVALSTFSKNFGYSATPLQELDVYFRPLMSLVAHGRFTKLYDGQKLVGYVFGYWDAAPAFCAANGNPEVLQNFSSSEPPRFLAHTIGVLKEYQKTGAAYLLFADIFGYAASSGRPGIACLTKEGATIFDKFLKSEREYRMLTKSIL